MAPDLIFQITKRFPGGAAIDAGLQLVWSDAPVTVLFGPSGSGKTTILRCLAGLAKPDGGVIRFGDETWFDAKRGILMAPQERRIGYLFQDYALFPHLTVNQNLAYGLNHHTTDQRRRRVAALVELFQIHGLETRYPRQLSGGQAQRVALARTVAPEPKLLLLDEPLSALDETARRRLRSELRALLLRVGIPTLLVTHDRTDAIALGDRLAVVAEGRVQQFGQVQEVFSRPANQAVAHSVGIETVLPGRIIGKSNGLLTIQSDRQSITAVDTGEFENPEVYLCIRAEDVILEQGSSSKGSARNHLPGRITTVIPEGPLVRVGLDCGLTLAALVTRQSCEDLNLQPGTAVIAVVKATAIHLLARGETSSHGSASSD